MKSKAEKVAKRAPKFHLDIPFNEALERYAGVSPSDIPPPKKAPPRGKKPQGGKVRSRQRNKSGPRPKGHA